MSKTASVPEVKGVWEVRKNEEGVAVDANGQKITVFKNTKKGPVKFILLSIITLGIYGLVTMCRVVKELNACRTAHGLDKSMNPVGVLFLSIITIGIVPIVWGYRLTKRLCEEAKYRQIKTKLKPSNFFVFGILLSVSFACPIILLSRILKTSNLIAIHHNTYGDTIIA